MGRDKASLSIGSISLLENTIRSLQEAGCQPLAVAAAPGQELPEISKNISYTICLDQWVNQGPLAGIASGLAHLERFADFCCVLPCDLPRINAAAIRALLAHAGLESPQPTCLMQGSMANPLIGVYPCSWHEKARKLLQNGRLRADGLLGDCPETRFLEAGWPDDCWNDCDTPGAWEALNQQGSGRGENLSHG